MARKRLNRRLVIALTLLTFACMIVVSILMLVQLQKGDPDKLAEIAQRHFDDGDYREATVFFGRAYRKGGQVDYLVRAGESLLQEGEVALALKAWRDALVQAPGLRTAHTHLLETLAEIARIHDGLAQWEQVRQAAEAMLAIDLPESDQAFAHNANGKALLKLASQSPEFADRGLKELEESVRLSPQNVDYAIDLASQRIARGEPEAGVSALEELLASHNEPSAGAAKARTAYGQYLASRGQLEEAQHQFEEAVRFAAGEPEALLEAKLAYADFMTRRWARAKVGIGDTQSADAFFDIAEKQMRESIAIDADAFDAYLQLAILYKAADMHDRVLEVCDERLRQRPPRKGLKAAENQLNTFRLLILASEACVAQAVNENQSDDMASRQEWLTRAGRYLDDAEAEYPEHPKVLSQRGRIKLAEGRDREALEDLRRADELYRTAGIVDWENKMRLARLHMSLNEAGAALAVLKEVEDKATGRQSIPFWDLYIRALLRASAGQDVLPAATARKIESALVSIESYGGDPAEVAKLRAAMYERMGNQRRAESLVESPADRALLRARSLAQDGEVEQALQTILKALAETPDDLRLVTTAVNELIRTDRTAEAHAIVQKALESAPDNTNFQRLAVLTGSEMTPEERDAALLEIIEKNGDAYQRAWDLIDFYWRRGDKAKALSYFDEAEKHLIDKDTPAARNATMGQHRALLKAKLFLAAGIDNEEAMAAARDAAVRWKVDGADGKSIVGLYHMYREEYEPALQAFTQAIASQPTDARLLTYLGQCYQAIGRSDDAKSAFEQAIRMNPGEGNAHKGLAAIAKLSGDEDAYETHLDQCARLLPADPWVKAELLTRRENEDPRNAIEQRKQRLAEDPGDLHNLARLAELSEKVGDIESADNDYRQLLAARPDDRNLVAAVAKYYRRTDRVDKALETVTQFAESRTTDEARAEALVLVAAHYLNQDDLDKVEATLLQAADVSSNLVVCRSLIDFYYRSRKDPQAALTWVERAIALARETKSPQLQDLLGIRIVCLLHRTVSDLDAARRFVDEFLREFPDNPRGLLWDAEVHARRGDMDGAIQSLTRYLVERPHDVYALYQRAQHYVAIGRTAAAMEDLEAIKRDDPTAVNIEPRLLLAHLHLQANRQDEWIAELESIVQAAPQSLVAVEELVGAYIQVDRLADADRLVTAQLNKAGDKAAAPWYFLRGRVSLAWEKPDEAISDYLQGAAASGYVETAVSEVLGVYLETGRYKDGITFFETHATEDTKTAVTMARYAHLLALDGRESLAVSAFRDAMVRSLSGEARLGGFVVREVLAAFSPGREVAEIVGLFQQAPADKTAARANDRILARLLGRMERFDEAEALLAKLLETATDEHERAVLLLEQGDMLQVAGRGKEAAASYERSIGYDPDNWVALNNAAYVLSDALADYEAALPYARRAVAIADISATLDTLGWIYVGLRRYPEAIAELSRSIRLDSSDPMAYYHLGEAFRRSERFIEATEALQHGRDIAGSENHEDAATLIEKSLDRVRRSDATP